MHTTHSTADQVKALEVFAEASSTGTAYEQLLAARSVDGSTCCPTDHGLSWRNRALLYEAHTLLAMVDMRFADVIHSARISADSWREADEHANELSMRMVELTGRIGESHRDAIAIVPMADKLDNLLTALEAAGPSHRRLIEAIMQVGFANLRLDRFEVARALFRKALTVSTDDIERARTLAASALCELQAGNDARARAQAMDAVALARATGDRLQLATLLRFIAGLYSDAHEMTVALQYAQEAVDLAEDLGDVFYASTLRIRGLLRIATGRGSEGCADLERSIRLVRASAWRHTLATEVLTLGQSLVGINEHDQAERLMAEYEIFLEHTDGEQRAEIDVLRYSLAIRSHNYTAGGVYAENVARILAAAHHKDAVTMYDAACDAWTLAGQAAHAQRCRTAADRLRA